MTHLGVGIAGTLLLVGDGAGAKFFRFNAGLATILLLIALAFRPEFAATAGPDPIGVIVLVVATGALLVYWASIGRALSALRPFLLWATVIGGVITMVTQGFNMSTGDMVALPLLTILSFLSSSALLGSTCTAMILGHWYLVLPVDERRAPAVDCEVPYRIDRHTDLGCGNRRVGRTGQLAIAVSAGFDQVRAVSRRRVSLAAGLVWIGVTSTPVVLDLGDREDPFDAVSPLGSSNVDFFTVVVGEMLAKYLLLSTRVPL